MKTITKQLIFKNYSKELYSDGYELNKSMGYTEFNKKEGCRYYLWPTYIDITDYFTSEEMLHNFYLGDIWEIDYNETPDADPKKWFGDEWTREYGRPNRWAININD